MHQAKHYICQSCMSGVAQGQQFCGRCGTPVPKGVAAAETRFFSDMQNPDKARLILIRGDGLDGLSYHLKAEQHILGRAGQIDFPNDEHISARHANFLYRSRHLVIRDEGSLNGVFVRTREPCEVSPGDTFMAGEQVFRVEAIPSLPEQSDAEGTEFYSSPSVPSAFRVTQILVGGADGMTVHAPGEALRIGREECEINFPEDVYLSPLHCTISAQGGKLVLVDHGSRNGTYVRIKGERTLAQGDYVAIGRKLMRVELNA